MVALDGHDWGSTPIRGIHNLASALDATVESGVMQEAAARNYGGSTTAPLVASTRPKSPGSLCFSLGQG
jgi:hypothetical protein